MKIENIERAKELIKCQEYINYSLRDIGDIGISYANICDAGQVSTSGRLSKSFEDDCLEYAKRFRDSVSDRLKTELNEIKKELETL